MAPTEGRFAMPNGGGVHQAKPASRDRWMDGWIIG